MCAAGGSLLVTNDTVCRSSGSSRSWSPAGQSKLQTGGAHRTSYVEELYVPYPHARVGRTCL
eukprot:CAMPEP_0179333540 /NCGR_PEP_ID=MMETSP0797-20121207/65387_1 /TAXON_ID=47934 /ORGANISM="Dinophysis acuminata, Strain DAEP01" /LENGTH=61 /DNA_ID=CAMNT_0021046613 /DNA_START=82 /DNA_END=264 /DNA_ORIENTATION=-